MIKPAIMNPDDFGGICNDGDLADHIVEAAKRVAGLTDRTKLTTHAKRLWRLGNQLSDLAEFLEI
jgi:hypothetical protein